MHSNQLKAGQQVEFQLCKQTVQGVMTDDNKIVIMQLDRGGRWYPNFIPIDLLEHIKFEKVRKKRMPIYEPDGELDIRDGDSSMSGQ